MPDYTPVGEEASALGEIKINHTVIASIVKMAATEVPGFVAVAGGGFVEEIAGIFTKKETGSGVQVEEDADGNYQIVVRVILEFGVQLAETAAKVQEVVRDKVAQMTSKKVSRVDVVIDGIKLPEGQGK